jgi:hypothetical protein
MGYDPSGDRPATILTNAGKARNYSAAMTKFGIFRDSELATDCDQCGGRVDLLKGGACVRCRRILCFRHLHGSFVRRLAADLGAQTLCVRCRAEGGAAGAETSS